jgi:hypothetical protein
VIRSIPFRRGAARGAAAVLCVAVVAVLSTGQGCISSPGFQCADSAACGAGGVCEPSGFCSFADSECIPSMRRYGSESGDLANECTEGNAPDIDAAEGSDAAMPPDAESPPDADIAEYTPSNIPADRLTAGTDDLVITAEDGQVIINTSAGTITRMRDSTSLLLPGVIVQEYSQADGPLLRIFSARNVVIGAGADVLVNGAQALVLAAAFDVTIDGHVDATGGRGTVGTPGPGGFAGGALSGLIDGRGAGGGKGVNVGDAGGGGGGNRAAGGAGGTWNVNAPMPEDRIPGGAGGCACGSSIDLRPLVGGSGGGSGGDSTQKRGVGGGGGGAVQISARGAIRIGATGWINVGGGGGGAGGGQTSMIDDAGGGGGSGGGILVEAKRVVVEGVLAANGGGGGAGGNGTITGERGETGKPSAVAAAGGAAGGTGAAGGAGGAGGVPGGAVGGSAPAPTFDTAGGGGGSGGRIRINATTPELRGVVSPMASLSQGTL